MDAIRKLIITVLSQQEKALIIQEIFFFCICMRIVETLAAK